MYTKEDYDDLRDFILWNVETNSEIKDILKPTVKKYVDNCSDSDLYKLMKDSIDKIEEHHWLSTINEWVRLGNKIPKIANQ